MDRGPGFALDGGRRCPGAAGLALGHLKGPFHRLLLPEAAAQQPRIYASLMTAEQYLCAMTILVVLAALWMSRARSSLTSVE